MLETTARSALCQRCTNCSRQHCTADYIQDFTKRKTRRDSEFLTKQQTIFATYRLVDQKCHEWEIKMWAATIDFMTAFESITPKSIWSALKSCGIEHDYIHFLRNLYRDQKASVLTDEESGMFEIKRGTKQGDPLSSLPFNTVMQKALEEDIPRWQKKRGTGTCLIDNDHDCSQASSEEQLQKCFANSSEVQKKCDSESIQERRKFAEPKLEHQTRNWDWQHQSRNINKRRVQNIWARWQFSSSRRRPKSEIVPGLLGQRSTCIDRSLHRELTCSDIDFGCSTKWYLRRWITSLELRHSQKSMKEWFNRRNAKCFDSSYKRKGDTKKIGKRKDETNEDDDAEDLGSIEDENVDGQSSNTQRSGQRRLFRERYRWWNWHNSDWRIRMDWIQKNTDEAPLRRWRMRRFDVGSRLIKEWNGDWRWESHLYQVIDG